MKFKLFNLLWCAFSLGAFAQSDIPVKSDIEEVTVYRQGAMITRAADVVIRAGNSTLVFSGLPAKLDPNSLQVRIASSNATIASVFHRIDYINKADISEEKQAMENQQRILRDSVRLLIAVINVFVEEKGMILSNKSIGGEDGVDIDQLTSGAEFFRKRLIEIESKSLEVKQQKFNLSQRLIRLSNELLELNVQSDVPTSQVRVNVTAKTAISSEVALDYAVNDAGWIPNYDIRIGDVSKPLQLFYKAKVFQNTGEDWESVDLTLSTGNPSISNRKPELQTYFLTFNNYYTAASAGTYETRKPSGGMFIQGRVIDAETAEPLIGVSVIAQGTQTGTSTDMEGRYALTVPEGSQSLLFRYIGYENQVQPIKSVVNVNLQSSDVLLDAVVISESRMSSRNVQSIASNSAGVYKQQGRTDIIPLAISKQQVSTTFKIELPYSIPSDQKAYDVTMIEYEVPAQYRYSAVPKISKEAYLIAVITDWTQYDLLDGTANLFFQGTYQGETYLDLQSFEDTLTLSVGRDKDILIEREKQKEFSKKVTIGSATKELRSWSIKVKNNKQESVEMAVEDQYPVSKTGEIKVDQLDHGDADLDVNTGKLTWTFTLKPGETKELPLKYEVKYPKGENLIVN